MSGHTPCLRRVVVHLDHPSTLSITSTPAIRDYVPLFEGPGRVLESRIFGVQGFSSGWASGSMTSIARGLGVGG